MSALNEIVNFVKDDLAIVKRNIQELSNKESEYSEEISKRLSHVLSSPGKQLRPVITLICSKLFGKIDKENSLRMATAVELLHIATLIHDDTVDRADVRRGKATASNLWGNNIAVLLGDYVFATSAIFVCDTGNIILVKRFAETIVELSKGELFENIESNNLNLTEISQKLNTLKNLTNKPVVTGFGIKTEKDINDLKGLSDGIVIGSPIVEKINADPSLKELQKYVEPIVKAIKNE